MGLTTCFYFIHSLPWRLFIVNNKNCENKNFLWNNTCSFAKNVVGYIYLYRKCPATGERYRAKEPSPCLFCLLVEEKGRGTMYHAPFVSGQKNRPLVCGELRSPGAAFKRHPRPISTSPILSKPGFPFHPNQTGKKPYNLMYVSIQLSPIPP